MTDSLAALAAFNKWSEAQTLSHQRGADVTSQSKKGEAGSKPTRCNVELRHGGVAVCIQLGEDGSQGTIWAMLSRPSSGVSGDDGDASLALASVKVWLPQPGSRVSIYTKSTSLRDHAIPCLPGLI